VIGDASDDSGLLLYCAYRPGPVELPDGLESVASDRLAIAARPVPAIADLQSPAHEDLIAFQQAVQSIFEQTTVVPFRFGSVARNRDDLNEMLRADAALWLDQLERFDGQVEMGLRLWLPKPAAGAPTRQQKPKTGADYLRARKAKYDAEKPYDANHPLIRGILDAVSGAYSEFDISFSSKNVELFGDTTASIAFLIPRGSHEDFFSRLSAAPVFDAIERSEVSGPWPPYSFAGSR
jgi:hypothetical protein